MTTPRLRSRILQGDCRDLLARLPDNSVDLVLTSPPYADLRSYARIRPQDYLDFFLPVARQLCRVLGPCGNFFLNYKSRCYHGRRMPTAEKLVVAMVDQLGLLYVDNLIWHKPNARPGAYGKRPKDAFEHVYHFALSREHYYDLSAIGRPYRKRPRRARAPKPTQPSGTPVDNRTAYRRGWADPGNVFTIAVPRNGTDHPAVMPSELAGKLIRLGSRPGEVVLDPFCGSGTTCLEAKRLGRRYIGIDLHRQYVELTRDQLSRVKRRRTR